MLLWRPAKNYVFFIIRFLVFAPGKKTCNPLFFVSLTLTLLQANLQCYMLICYTFLYLITWPIVENAAHLRGGGASRGLPSPLLNTPLGMWATGLGLRARPYQWWGHPPRPRMPTLCPYMILGYSKCLRVWWIFGSFGQNVKLWLEMRIIPMLQTTQSYLSGR